MNKTIVAKCPFGCMSSKGNGSRILSFKKTHTYHNHIISEHYNEISIVFLYKINDPMIAYNAIAPNLVKEVDMDLGAVEEGKKIKLLSVILYKHILLFYYNKVSSTTFAEIETMWKQRW